MRKLIAIILVVAMCLSLFVGCGEKDPAKTQSPAPTTSATSGDKTDDGSANGIKVGTWETYDSSNIVNFRFAEGGVAFDYVDMQANSYKGAYAVVSGHTTDLNLCTVTLKNLGDKTMNVRVALEDKEGDADWKDPDTAVYSSAYLPAGETVEVPAYLYSNEYRGDWQADAFTGEVYKVKVFPDSTADSKNTKNGSIAIVDVQFSKYEGEIPQPKTYGKDKITLSSGWNKVDTSPLEVGMDGIDGITGNRTRIVDATELQSNVSYGSEDFTGTITFGNITANGNINATFNYPNATLIFGDVNLGTGVLKVTSADHSAKFGGKVENKISIAGGKAEVTLSGIVAEIEIPAENTTTKEVVVSGDADKITVAKASVEVEINKAQDIDVVATVPVAVKANVSGTKIDATGSTASCVAVEVSSANKESVTLVGEATAVVADKVEENATSINLSGDGVDKLYIEKDMTVETLNIASGKSLVVENGATLTVSGATTNAGTIKVDGTFNANTALENDLTNGTITGTGSTNLALLGTITAVARHKYAGEIAIESQVNDDRFDIELEPSNRYYTLAYKGTADWIVDGIDGSTDDDAQGKWLGAYLTFDDAIDDIETVKVSSNGSTYSALEDDVAYDGGTKNTLMMYMNGENPTGYIYLKDANGVVYTIKRTATPLKETTISTWTTYDTSVYTQSENNGNTTFAYNYGEVPQGYQNVYATISNYDATRTHAIVKIENTSNSEMHLQVVIDDGGVEYDNYEYDECVVQANTVGEFDVEINTSNNIPGYVPTLIKINPDSVPDKAKKKSGSFEIISVEFYDSELVPEITRPTNPGGGDSAALVVGDWVASVDDPNTDYDEGITVTNGVYSFTAGGKDVKDGNNTLNYNRKITATVSDHDFNDYNKLKIKITNNSKNGSNEPVSRKFNVTVKGDGGEKYSGNVISDNGYIYVNLFDGKDNAATNPLNATSIEIYPDVYADNQNEAGEVSFTIDETTFFKDPVEMADTTTNPDDDDSLNVTFIMDQGVTFVDGLCSYTNIVKNDYKGLQYTASTQIEIADEFNQLVFDVSDFTDDIRIQFVVEFVGGSGDICKSVDFSKDDDKEFVIDIDNTKNIKAIKVFINREYEDDGNVEDASGSFRLNSIKFGKTFPATVNYPLAALDYKGITINLTNEYDSQYKFIKIPIKNNTDSVGLKMKVTADKIDDINGAYYAPETPGSNKYVESALPKSDEYTYVYFDLEDIGKKADTLVLWPYLFGDGDAVDNASIEIGKIEFVDDYKQTVQEDLTFSTIELGTGFNFN